MKVMVMVGGLIGVLFVVVIVGVLIVFYWVGMSGLFVIVGVLLIFVIGVVLWIVFDVVKFVYVFVLFVEVLYNVELLCLNFGVLVLYVM